MGKRRATARKPGNRRAAKVPPNTKAILHDEAWTYKVLARVFLALFAVMSFGAVFLGW